MGQFSSAAYCANNHNSVGDKIKCSGGSCPLVEAANTTTLAEFANFPGTDVTGYVALDHTNKLTIISFRGSSSIENWMTNLDFRDTTTDLCPGCTAHNGFWQSWVDARPGVLTAIKKAIATAPKYSIVATGHSLGGAIATLAAAQLRNEKHTVALYTFGAPRVSGPALAAYISAQPGGNFRVTNRNDPVPRLPPFFLGFTHITPEYYIGRKTGETPVIADMRIFDGVNSMAGNSRWVVTDVDAHLWYFRSMSRCAIEKALGKVFGNSKE
ncbi:Alpha/Beta hydrolase protein [Dendryphion nanum]|uniref:Alpha/Beta hydrolase protein n=1 Tax=Dendryphion nanum TaxID=256645 RepID=A0A9P9DV41_9PLEO|nr:Alpha/Beta hydrolase protein [Dendryphion nanum]